MHLFSFINDFKLRYIIPIVVLCFLFSCDKSEKTNIPVPATFAQLEEQIVSVLNETKTPGASVAVISSEGMEYAAGIGLSDVSVKKKATEDTLFRIGSVSKTFTALSILKLQNEGRLALSDTVKSVAPEIAFKIIGRKPILSGLCIFLNTLRDLTTGR